MSYNTFKTIREEKLLKPISIDSPYLQDEDHFYAHPYIIYDKTIDIFKHDLLFGKAGSKLGKIDSKTAFSNKEIYTYMMSNCTIYVGQDSKYDFISFVNCYFYKCTFVNIIGDSLYFSHCILEDCTIKNVNIERNIVFNVSKVFNTKIESSIAKEIIIMDQRNFTTGSECSYDCIGIPNLNRFIVDESMKDFKMVKKKFDHKVVQIEDYKLLGIYGDYLNKLINNFDIRSCYQYKDYSRNSFLSFCTVSPTTSDVTKRLMDNKKILFNDIIDLPAIGYSFIGYKLVAQKLCSNRKILYIAELLIHRDAKRSVAGGIKCRCDKAKVIAVRKAGYSDEYIKNYLNEPKITSKSAKYFSPFSTYVTNNSFNELVYELDKEVSVDDFDSNRWNECTRGIHFFWTVKDLIETYRDEILECNGKENYY